MEIISERPLQLLRLKFHGRDNQFIKEHIRFQKVWSLNAFLPTLSPVMCIFGFILCYGCVSGGSEGYGWGRAKLPNERGRGLDLILKTTTKCSPFLPACKQTDPKWQKMQFGPPPSPKNATFTADMVSL